MKIYKYTVKIVDEQKIEMPKNAIILDCQLQNTFFISMWAIVDPDAETEHRVFEIIGTGNDVSLRPRNYIATVNTGIYVWHVFEVLTD